MSEDFSNFMSMNDDMKLRLAYAEIARLKDALSDSNRGQIDLVAHDAELRADFNRQREEDRQFFKSQMDDLKSFYKQQLVEQSDRHKQEIRDLQDKHQANLKQVFEEHNLHTSMLNRQISKLTDQITVLTSNLDHLKLSEAEARALASFRKRQLWKRSSEQQKLLKSGSEVTREEEKNDYPDQLDNGSVANHPSEENVSANDKQHENSTNKTARKKDGRSQRTDYAKNKPYTSSPQYHYLDEYFTMPAGGKYIMRDGKIDSWWYRKLVRIPEHYEEHFYQVASVYIPGVGKILTKENDRLIKGCPFDLEMIVYILTEHFRYNTPFTKICEKLSHMGLEMNDKTLGVIVHKVITYLRKQMKQVWEDTICQAHNWMIDETPGLVGVKDENGNRHYRSKYFWGIKANVMKLVWFVYESGSRGFKAIRKYLDKFIGFFTTDGYVVYKVYDNEEHPQQLRSSCLTHIRRYLVDALDEHRELIMWFIDEVGRMFAQEYESKKLGESSEERLKRRLKHTKPIMGRIKDKFESLARNKFSKLGVLTVRALKYMKNEWKAMERILQDGNLEISNNLAEQMMRHIKLNLKNCLNIGSEDSALDYAFMFSVSESCDMNGVTMRWYLGELIQKLAGNPVDKTRLLPCYINK